jgi:hypothetical protein
MKPLKTIGALAVVAALAVPALASAHPSVYTDTARVIADPANPAVLTDQTRHVITNHGFTSVLRETNGVIDRGMITYSRLPSAYRNRPGFTKTQLLAEGDTGAQPHAVCRVASLDAEDAVLAWQEDDPFYNYVPFQAGAAKLDDDPSHWLPVVQARTGVDLTRVADPAAACAGLGGTYHPADETQSTAASLASGTVEEETAPLNAQIDQLKKDKAAADGATAAANRATAAALARVGLLETPLKVTPAPRGSMRSGIQVKVTGRPLSAVSVRLLASKARKTSLKLRSRVLTSQTVALAADGTKTITLKPGKSTNRALRRIKSLGTSVDAVTLGKSATAGAKLTR